MADSEIVSFLLQNPSEGLNITLEERLSTISEDGMRTADYWLKYRSRKPRYSQEQFLENVGPERLGNGTKAHPQYNLQSLAGNIDARLPVREQLTIMKHALDRIAEIDPRIKGEKTEPIAPIVRVGGRPYDLSFMQQFYAYVQREYQNKVARQRI
jgi:hypothetical protein